MLFKIACISTLSVFLCACSVKEYITMPCEVETPLRPIKGDSNEFDYLKEILKYTNDLETALFKCL